MKEEKQYKKLKNNINTKIKELHKIVIYHGNLHSNNIFLDHVSKEIKIIDFGRSMFIEDMFEENIESLVEDINTFLETQFKEIQDIIDFDFDMYKRNFLISFTPFFLKCSKLLNKILLQLKEVDKLKQIN